MQRPRLQGLASGRGLARSHDEWFNPSRPGSEISKSPDTTSIMTMTNHFSLSGKRAALEAAWQLLCRYQGDIPFAEIVKFVRARAPRLSEERIRADFDRRLRSTFFVE